MGKISKISKNVELLMSIDSNTHMANVNNYHHYKTKKTQIILGGSLRKDNNHIKHLKIKDFGKSKKWPTYSIGRDGSVYQHFDPNYYSDYMGKKEVDEKSISIVLENMGMLFYDGSNECFQNWINEECNDKHIYEKLWKNCRYWETYSQEQYISLKFLINNLIRDFNIKRNCLGYNVYDENTIKFEGIVTRSNYDQNYSDLNPSFDFKKLLDILEIKI